MRAVALVGLTPLGREIGSFLMRLARPEVPLSLHGSYDEARAWVCGKLDSP